jgi:hypothetical protein
MSSESQLKVVEVSTESKTVEGDLKTIFTRLQLQADPKEGTIKGSIAYCELLPNPSRENAFFESHYSEQVVLTGAKQQVIVSLMKKDISEEAAKKILAILEKN